MSGEFAHPPHPESDGVTDIVRWIEPGQEKPSAVKWWVPVLAVARAGIAAASEPEGCKDGKGRIFHGILGQEIPCNSHPACIRVGKWLHDHPADVRSAGQGTEPSRRLTMGTKQCEHLSAFPARSPSLESPTVRTRAADLRQLHRTCALVWIRLCGSWQRGGQVLAAALLGPDMSEPGVPGLVGSVRTRLQRFAVRDHDHQEGII